MKRTINVMLVILIAFSLLSVYRTYTAQTTSPPMQPVHNINTGLNYTTIQAAIDAPETLDGHTLRCDAGNYTENVHVYKSLEIIGAGPTLTYRIPFEPNDTFYIAANNVTIEGFTIQSVSGYLGVSACEADNCGILNNVFMGSGGGILLRSSNDNTVSGNEMDSLPGDGITLTDSSQGNEIVSNSLNRNHYGIQVRNASNYNVIASNFVNSSTVDGIRLNWQGSNYAPVAFNNITNNIICHNHDGIFLDYPSNNNLVSDNMASDNTIGIRLRQTNSSNVVRNTVISNSYLGISTESSYANAIDDNFLNNTANAWDNGVNTWNEPFPIGAFPPTPINIIGGYFMGGNYWCDNPNPIDLNKDGIGDVPYSILGGSNKDGLPLVTQLSIFIASFMTPEGEPYPFDITISNGTWKRNFTNVTHAVTEVPNATYTIAYYREGVLISGRFSLTFNALTIHLLEFYAISHKQMIYREQPYVAFQEKDADTALAWHWNSTNLSLNWTVSVNGGKYAGIVVGIDDDVSSPPNYVMEAEGSGCHKYSDHLIEPLNCRKCRMHLTPEKFEFQQFLADARFLDTHTVKFEEISPSRGTIRIGYPLDNSSILVYPISTSLRNLDGTQEGIESFFDPQYAVEGNKSYILSINNLPGGYAQLDYPIYVRAGDGIDLDVFPPRLMNLQNFTFSAAGEFFCADSQYSDLTHSLANKTITVNVSTETNYDWWGCFILPRTRMVRALTAYSGNASYQLRKLYDYTEQIVGDYDIVTVRIPPEIDRLALDYIVSTNNNAVMDVAPLKTVIGQGYSAKTNVTVYVGVPAEPMNITVYANQTIIGALTNVTLPCGNCTVMTFPWNTTSFAYGNYTTCACAWPVPGETDTSDNNFTCCFAVHVGVPGDVSGPTLGVYDGKCDMRDVSYLIIRFNSKPDSPNWNPNADINDDGTVNMRDISIGILNFNKHE